MCAGSGAYIFGKQVTGSSASPRSLVLQLWKDNLRITGSLENPDSWVPAMELPIWRVWSGAVHLCVTGSSSESQRTTVTSVPFECTHTPAGMGDGHENKYFCFNSSAFEHILEKSRTNIVVII